MFKFGAWIAHQREPTATVGLYSGRSVGDGAEKISPPTARVVYEDYCEAFQQGSEYVVRDSKRFLTEWSFDPAIIDVPVAGWYGDADSNVPPAHGEYLEKPLPSADISIEEELDHLGVLIEFSPAAIRSVAP